MNLKENDLSVEMKILGSLTSIKKDEFGNSYPVGMTNSYQGVKELLIIENEKILMSIIGKLKKEGYLETMDWGQQNARIHCTGKGAEFYFENMNNNYGN